MQIFPFKVTYYPAVYPYNFKMILSAKSKYGLVINDFGFTTTTGLPISEYLQISEFKREREKLTLTIQFFYFHIGNLKIISRNMTFIYKQFGCIKLLIF